MRNIGRKVLHFLVLLICISVAYSQQNRPILKGQVTDALGGVLSNITVTATDSNGVKYTTQTDSEGKYSFAQIPAGKYKVSVEYTGFSPYESIALDLTAKETANLEIVMTIAEAVMEVTVDADEVFPTDPSANADSVIFREKDLEMLPDDGDSLMEFFQTMAGPTANLDNSPQIIIDGFRGNPPPKSAIREVRLNNNPFAAEYDQMGNGRVEILTKPGTNELRGQTLFSFNDEVFNSRSPFTLIRAPYQSTRYGGNLSGPVVAKKSSFFVDFEKRTVEDNREINAIILDSSLNPVSFNQAIVAPTSRVEVSPRIDWQFGNSNTLVARYRFSQNRREGDGIGGFNLDSRGYNSKNVQHTFQVTDTTVINQNTFNETRIQFVISNRSNEGGTFDSGIRILDAFNGGGAQMDASFNNERRLEIQNFTSRISKKHSIKFGARIRWGNVLNNSQQDYAGTFTFGGGSAPQLDENNQIIRDENGNILRTTINSLERYRRTLLFQSLGYSPAEIRTHGGGATQFSILGGTPEINYSQTDFSPFFQDDWKIKPNLTLSLGVRYDMQNNVSSTLNFAPRVSVAWSPAARKDKQLKTVFRAGFGIFYDRFNESMLSQSLRFDGITQQQFVITTSESGQQFLDLYPNAPTIDQLSSFQVRQTLRQIDENLETPYTNQAAFTFEQQLPRKTSLSVNYLQTQTSRLFRSRNINAPLVNQNNVRPLPNQGNIFQFESTGRFEQHQLSISINNRLSKKINITANYSLTDARSDTDGMGTFPINQYDLSGEFARSIPDIRHRFTLFSSLNILPWGILLNPSFVINSGRPFNITIGRDLNRDALFTERPAFADAQTTTQDLRQTQYGDFDINPKSGQTIIPRNFGTGASFTTIDLRISKEFKFNLFNKTKDGKKRYSLNFSTNIQNLTNTTNEAIPVGNLSSPLFGIANRGAGRFGSYDGSQSAGNRRIDFQLRFNF